VRPDETPGGADAETLSVSIKKEAQAKPHSTAKMAAPIAAAPAAAPKPMASPAVRRRADDAGVDLRRIRGTGRGGRITQDDLDAYLKSGGEEGAAGGLIRNASITEIRLVGLRRKIAEKMATANARIPHITYVEEVDVTALEDLREKLNETREQGQPKLTILPFLMRAMVNAIAEHPRLNAHFDEEAGVIRAFGACHIGVATQTPDGLMVPVARHAEARDIWGCAAEIARLSEAARNGKAAREELLGSTITITSLGAMGGIVTTPIINHPEVAIIGVNKIQILPKWDGAQFVPRKVMNLSSSFDHRVVDGWDAALFVQRIKKLLETPAMILADA
jgi:2-oxoisovalerate dehydrogenase E2 component (dihydrolipoyl transacylase)